ncbi:MAG: SDR family oxidoreductase [Ilumatobacter sp.]|nr:MAG: SDR family oxidoreductase [Ilumatobacter sp.]
MSREQRDRSRTICVTGVASGIGAATAALLRRDGCHVIGVDQRDAEVVADLSTADGRQAAVAGVLDASGGVLDGFVPCAGVGGLQSADLTVRINYFGVQAMLNGLRSALAAGDRAAVVLISSNSTTTTPGLSIDDAQVYLDGDEAAAVNHFAARGWMAYPAGKLALAFWTRASSAAWLADGIRLNAVAPGVIDTGMTRPLLDIDGIKEALDEIPIPAGRWGDAAEVASAIGFLLSPSTSYVVGQVLFIDGGTDAFMHPFAHPRPFSAGGDVSDGLSDSARTAS